MVRRWLDAVVDVLDENRHALTELLARSTCPARSYHPPEATYLAWLDCRGARDSATIPPSVPRARRRAEPRSAVRAQGGEGHVRINLATSPHILADTVAAMAG